MSIRVVKKPARAWKCYECADTFGCYDLCYGIDGKFVCGKCCPPERARKEVEKERHQQCS